MAINLVTKGERKDIINKVEVDENADEKTQDLKKEKRNWVANK